MKKPSSGLSTSTRTHNMMNPERICKICSFVHNDHGSLPANRKKFHFFSISLPKVSQIVSIGKLSLQSSVPLLYLPYRNVCCSLPCQSICAHGGTEKPIICYHLICACNGGGRSETHLYQVYYYKYTETAFHCWALFFLCLLLSFAKDLSQLSIKLTYSSP